MFPKPVVEYNTHMGGSDGNAQQRSCASPASHRDVRYWWPIFIFILEASVLNAYILHKLGAPGSTSTKREFQRQIALSLLRNPAGQSRERSTLSNPIKKRKYAGPEHEWKHLKKRQYCTVCSKELKILPLQSIDANARKRRRAPQSSWGCNHPDCTDKAICKPGCWEKAHNGGLGA